MAGTSPRRLPVSRELAALVATLRSPAPYVVLGVALVALAVAYQVRPTYTLQAGGKTDAPFWNGVNGGESDPHTPVLTYRWTQPAATLTLPGAGAGAYRLQLDLNGARPPGFPPPELLVSAGGAPFADLHPAPARQTVAVSVPAAATAGGDLHVTLQTRNPFSPRGDPRRLGVQLFAVQAVPAGNDLALPPLGPWLLLSAAAAVAALLLGLCGWGPAVVRAGGLLWALAEAGFLLFDRLWLTLIPGVLVGVLLTAGLLLLIFGPLWRRLYRAGGCPWPEADQRRLLGIYGGAFVARLAGQLHPQTVVIDLVFHAHQLEKVLRGQLLFTIPSDEWAGHQTFYLPTPYVFMLPLQWLLHDELLTIRLFTVGLDTATVFLVYYLARRAFADGRAGLIAAGLAVTFPLAVLPFSWGITANLFGGFAGLAALAAAVGLADRLTRPGPWLLLVALLVLTFLSHPGTVQLSGALLAGVLVVWGLGVRGQSRGVKAEGSGARSAGSRNSIQNSKLALERSEGFKIQNWLALLAALAVAAAIAWAGYYAHFAAFELQQLAQIRQERAAASAGQGFSIKVGGEVNDRSLGLVQRIVHDRGTWLVESGRGLGAEAWAYFHAWPLLWAMVGFVAVRTGPAPARGRMRTAAAVAALVVLGYAGVGVATNLYVRYALFALPFVALGAGLLLSALARRGALGRLLVAAILLATTLDALSFWYMRITFANK